MSETVVLSPEINLLLLLYPETFRRRYGREMSQLLIDMIGEQREENGKITLGFWLHLIGDTLKSSFREHFNELRKSGLKTYLRQNFRFTGLHLLGLLLLLPSISVLSLDVISRILQGDLIHYNRPVYAFLSKTFFYRTPVLFIWVILFPALAVLINLLPFISAKYRGRLVSFILLVFGLGFLSIILFHDFAPCMLHGLFSHGFSQFGRLLSFCRQA